jgi:uncharacterized protein DUF6690
MGGRPLMLATMLGASIGVPYVMSQANSGPKTTPSPQPAASAFGGQPAGFNQPGVAAGLMTPPPLLASPATPSAVPTTTTKLPVEGVRFHSIAEVLRFDVTKEWVYNNWPRKSTGLADTELFGIRVPLVTGTGYGDLAGALTYQFNQQGQVQHITFHGRTADTTPLIQFLTATYHFERRDALPGQQLYQVGSGDEVTSELGTRPESVLWNTTPHGSFVVDFELEQPGSTRYLPSRALKLAIPPAPPGPAIAANGAGTAPGAPAGQNAAGEQSYYDKFMHATYDNVRYATPAEQNQVQWKRWPN